MDAALNIQHKHKHNNKYLENENQPRFVYLMGVTSTDDCLTLRVNEALFSKIRSTNF